MKKYEKEIVLSIVVMLCFLGGHLIVELDDVWFMGIKLDTLIGDLFLLIGFMLQISLILLIAKEVKE